MKLTILIKKIEKLNLPFIISSFGIVVILLWVGSFKFYEVEAVGVAPLVTNSPLVSWDYAIFGIRTGASLIGITEIIAAILIIIGSFRPKAGIIGSIMAVVIFFVTSTFVITTPGSVHLVEGVPRLSDMGSFLFKDITLLGASLYLLVHFDNRMKPTTK